MTIKTFFAQFLLYVALSLINFIRIMVLKGKEVLFFYVLDFCCGLPELAFCCVIYFYDNSTALSSARGKCSAVCKGGYFSLVLQQTLQYTPLQKKKKA